MYTNDEQIRIFDEIFAEYGGILQNICMQYIGQDESYRAIVDLSVETTIWMAVRKYETLKATSSMEEWLVDTCAHRFAGAIKRQKYENMDDPKAEGSVEQWMQEDTAIRYAEQLLEALATREAVDFGEYLDGVSAYHEPKHKGFASRIKAMFGMAV